MIRRLRKEDLNLLPDVVERPRYDRQHISTGIVHLGVGAFHRAHQAVAIDDCLASGATDWGITAVSLRSTATRDALAAQDYLYTVLTRSSHGTKARVVGSILRILVAPEDPEAVLSVLSEKGVRIVTLTVTEKGYLRADNGDLDLSHPDIVQDLANPHAPRSIYGFIAIALQRRLDSGIPPFTILTCDNLPSNGRTLKRLLSQFVQEAIPELSGHVATSVSCPCTMVDRIVPATTESDKNDVRDTGLVDEWPVVTEPFYSWVMEDDFPSGRPHFITDGIKLVPDVEPYELMKLRLLNGAHSSMAYAGLLLGHVTVAQAIADPVIKGFVEQLWCESAATLDRSQVEPDFYCDALLERFGNTALHHRLEQIGTDGSQKLPQRIVRPMIENIAEGRPFKAQALSIALWIMVLNTPFSSRLTDPSMQRVRDMMTRSDALQFASAMMAMLGGDPKSAAATAIADNLEMLRVSGVSEALKSFNQSKTTGTIAS